MSYLGAVVIYNSKNGDGVMSPAVVLRTTATTVAPQDIKEGPHEPAPLPEGFSPNLNSAYHLDLLVHGLGKDYREYNVPYSEIHAPATWSYEP